jgi:hypothetical protein
MNRAYLPVRDALLRRYNWNFAIVRIQLPASSTKPLFGKAYSYPLPGDFLDLAPTQPTFGVSSGGPVSGFPEVNDWQIEGHSILSDDVSPLNVRYITSSKTESQYDASFAEALSASLAINTCEELTQSNTKIQVAKAFYDDAIEIAKQRNAFENRPVTAPLTSWITSRY